LGIALDDFEQVFEEFRQVGQSETKHEGTGLGLALTKKLVELDGGHIWADRRQGHPGFPQEASFRSSAWCRPSRRQA
jgi:signal transduction histidine kinase